MRLTGNKSEVVTNLLDNNDIEFIYSSHYGVYIIFRPDGVVTIDDGDRGQREYAPLTDPAEHVIDVFCKDIYTVLERVRDSSVSSDELEKIVQRQIASAREV